MRVMRINRYQTSDGEEFTSKEAAEEHELKGHMADKLEQMLFGDAEVDLNDVGNLTDWMINNRAELTALLNVKIKIEV